MSWFGTPPAGLDMYHVGVVVPDVRAAMTRYGEARQARVAATYSLEGPPYLELVEERSGGVWAAAALGLQHVGLWTDDLEGSITRFDAAGLPGRVRHLPGEGKPALFSYHDGGAGLWWELVSTAFRPRLEARLRTREEQR